MGRLAGAGTGAGSVFAVGAAKLIHEARDDAMEVKTIVKTFVDQSDEVAASDWHLFDEDFRLEVAHGCFEFSSWVAHGATN